LRRRVLAGAAAVVVALLAVWSARALARWSVGVPESTAQPAEQLVNPLTQDAETIALGRRLYTQNCAFCHGAGGQGNGRAAPGLIPPPSDLTSVGARRMTDAQLYTFITSGVAKTSMPAWEKVLDPGQRWAVVTFIRAELQR
jgi:copper transport protein